MSKRSKIIVAILSIVLAFALALMIAVPLIINSPQIAGDKKTITVEVIHGDKSRVEREFVTYHDNLWMVVKKDNFVCGYESGQGIWVTTVDGEQAEDAEQQWWCITQNGVMTNYSIDTQPIKDGDHFELTLTTGW